MPQILLDKGDFQAEFNPFSPSGLSDSGEGVGDFLREQAENLRRIHNVNQGGDSTFPWQLMVETQRPNEPWFNTGSLGRFYHEDYGIILARYVKFGVMIQTPFFASPVGLINGSPFAWHVTNDKSKSHTDLLVGICAAYEIPEEGAYGWVIVSGSNLASLSVEDGGSLTPNVHLGWKSNGVVSPLAGGRTIGRRVGGQTGTQLDAGQVLIEPSDWSKVDLLAEITDSQGPVLLRLTNVETLLTTHTGQITDLYGRTATLDSQVGTLFLRIAAEESTRAAAIQAINNQLAGGTVTQAKLDNAINGLTISFNNSQAVQDVRINDALDKANQALVKVDSVVGFDPTAIMNSITEINKRLGTLAYTASQIAFVPAGSIAATDVQAAIVELDTDLTALSAAFTAHTHTASQITDFSEAVDDRVAALLVAGTGIGLSYNDAGNQLTISNTATAWTYVKLGADFTTSNTTPQDSGLAFTPAANKNYEFECQLRLMAADVTEGPQPHLVWPTTGMTGGAAFMDGTNGTTGRISANASWGPTTTTLALTAVPANSRQYPAVIRGNFTVDGTAAGDFKIQLRAETGAFSVTIKAGSFIRYREY